MLGGELSGSWADIYGDAKCYIAFFVCNTKIDWFGTATGRVGWADGHVLYYGKGGAAVVHDKYHMNAAQFTNTFDGSETRWGWTIGAGIEYAFAPAWSAFAEYDYMDFGTEAVDMTDQFDNLTHINIRQNVQTLKFGVNHRLGGADNAFADASGPDMDMSDWSIDAGTRLWVSSGRMKKDLYDPFVPGQQSSRLTYGPEIGVSLEGFLRLQNANGLLCLDPSLECRSWRPLLVFQDHQCGNPVPWRCQHIADGLRNLPLRWLRPSSPIISINQTWTMPGATHLM